MKKKKRLERLTDEELARIRPSELVESFDGDPTAVVDLSFVNNVGSFLSVLGDYVVGGESIRCGFEVLEAELAEARPQLPITLAPILCASTTMAEISNTIYSFNFIFKIFLSETRKMCLPRSEVSRTEGFRWEWNQQRENLEQRAPIDGERERVRVRDRMAELLVKGSDGGHWSD